MTSFIWGTSGGMDPIRIIPWNRPAASSLWSLSPWLWLFSLWRFQLAWSFQPAATAQSPSGAGNNLHGCHVLPVGLPAGKHVIRCEKGLLAMIPGESRRMKMRTGDLDGMAEAQRDAERISINPYLEGKSIFHHHLSGAPEAIIILD